MINSVTLRSDSFPRANGFWPVKELHEKLSTSTSLMDYGIAVWSLLFVSSIAVKMVRTLICRIYVREIINLREAFQIGNEIIAAVTAMRQDPVALKMEKLYYPTKQIMGVMTKSNLQFDAEGIDTVCRGTRRWSVSLQDSVFAEDNNFLPHCTS